jgi:tRNA threonylcarbamoyladenosine biosynthesis protein TsaB
MINAVAIETTGLHLGLALYRVDAAKKTFRSRGQVFIKAALKQSDLLFPLLTRLLKKAGVTKNKIGLLIVDVGPGSFTGVRVGVATARALGQALSVPVVGVDSLEAIARQKKSGRVIPWLPALAGEVYHKIGKEARWGTQAEFDEAVRQLKVRDKRIVLVSGAPHVRDVAEIGIEAYLKRPSPKTFHYSRVSPLYLQPSWAERKKAR